MTYITKNNFSKDFATVTNDDVTISYENEVIKIYKSPKNIFYKNSELEVTYDDISNTFKANFMNIMIDLEKSEETMFVAYENFKFNKKYPKSWLLTIDDQLYTVIISTSDEIITDYNFLTRKERTPESGNSPEYNKTGIDYSYWYITTSIFTNDKLVYQTKVTKKFLSTSCECETNYLLSCDSIVLVDNDNHFSTGHDTIFMVKYKDMTLSMTDENNIRITKNNSECEFDNYDVMWYDNGTYKRSLYESSVNLTDEFEIQRIYNKVYFLGLSSNKYSHRFHIFQD